MSVFLFLSRKIMLTVFDLLGNTVLDQLGSRGTTQGVNNVGMYGPNFCAHRRPRVVILGAF